VLLATIVIALAVSLAGWRIASGFGAAAPHHPAASSPAARPTAGRFVRVNGAALAGQPARAVARLLRRSGLLVTVTRQPARHAEPGTVLRVYPTGKIQVGSPVTVVAVAFSDRGHGHGRGNGDGSGNNQGGGD